MSEKEIETWLKVGSQNKITQKNTWSANIIDYFNSSTFEENNGVNFQKATSALDTCVKVYTTRVDDVSTSMNKLLDNFSHTQEGLIATKERKRERNHKKVNTLATDDRAICLKDLGSYEFFDGYFTKHMKEGRGFLNCDLRTDGFLRVFSEEVNDLLFLKFDKDFNISLKNKVICPSFSKLEEYGENIEENESDNENEATIEPGYDDITDQEMANDIMDDFDYNFENVMPEEENDLQPIINKSWAGPNFWKLPPKRKYKNNQTAQSEEKTKKEKYSINFNIKVDKAALFDTGNISIDKDTIQTRRNEKNMLPVDYRFKTSDLYNFLVCEGNFKHLLYNSAADNSFGNDFSGNNTSFNNIDGFNDNKKTNENTIIEENISKIEIENLESIKENNNENAEKNIQTEFSQNILKKHNIIPKKIDMKKLKENLYNMVDKSSKKIKLLDAYQQVTRKYNEKESKDLTIHYCIVSLLHLANEKNLRIEENDDTFVLSLNKK